MNEPPRRSFARTTGLVAHAGRALWRRRGKSFALGGGLVLTVALVAAVLFLTDALRAEADRARAGMPDIVVQRLIGGRPTSLSITDAAKLGEIPSVRAVTPRVWGYLFVPALAGNVTIVGAHPGDPTLSTVAGGLASGRDLAPGAHEMVAGEALARFLGVILGDQLGLPSSNPDAPPLALVGTFGSSVGLYAADVVLTSEADARALLGIAPGEATDITVSVINPDETHVIARTIATRLPGVRIIEKELLGRVYDLAYGRRSGIVLAASIPALLALLILAWDRASGLGPEEKHEVAILKAVGWSTADVLWVKLAESVLVSFSAAAVGLVLAYVWVFVLGAPGLRPTLAGWSVLYPESPLTPVVDGGEILAMLLAVVAPFVALSIVPAWKAATLDPMESMRS